MNCNSQTLNIERLQFTDPKYDFLVKSQNPNIGTDQNRTLESIPWVLFTVALLIKFEEIPMCGQIGLEGSLFVGNLGLRAPRTIFSSFAPASLLGSTLKPVNLYGHLYPSFLKRRSP